jgi:hypothetical protein
MGSVSIGPASHSVLKYWCKSELPLAVAEWNAADILVLKLRCHKCSAYAERPPPPLVEEEVPLYASRREQKSWSWISTWPKARNDCAGEGRQQFNRPTYRPLSQDLDFWHRKGFYFPHNLLTRSGATAASPSEKAVYCLSPSSAEHKSKVAQIVVLDDKDISVFILIQYKPTLCGVFSLKKRGPVDRI